MNIQTFRKRKLQLQLQKLIKHQKLTDVRSISGLLNSDKIFETLLDELIVGEMEINIDPSQFGNSSIGSGCRKVDIHTHCFAMLSTA